MFEWLHYLVKQIIFIRFIPVEWDITSVWQNLQRQPFMAYSQVLSFQTCVYFRA